jgi:hypothetical protein
LDSSRNGFDARKYAKKEVATAGLSPKSQYQVYLSESEHSPFGKLEPLAILKTNADRAGIVQAIGPLKVPQAEARLPPIHRHRDS